MLIKILVDLDDAPAGYQAEVFKDVCGSNCFIDAVGDRRHIDPISPNCYVLFLA